jgi:hypothetical protein
MKRGRCGPVEFCHAIELSLALGGIDGSFPLLRSRYT